MNQEEYNKKLMIAYKRSQQLILYPDLYEEQARKLQDQDKTLVYNDEEMEEEVWIR